MLYNAKHGANNVPSASSSSCPSLTEATSPYWRPIKYSLFPPLGLATLAAYLRPDDDAVIVDEHVETAVAPTTRRIWS